MAATAPPCRPPASAPDRSPGPGVRRFGWLGYGLFFLMLFVPTTYQPLKAALLGVLLCFLLFGWLGAGIGRLERSVLCWVLVLVATGAFFMLRGHARAAPGAWSIGTVYALWPLVFTALVGGVTSTRAVSGLARVLVLGTLAVGVYGTSYILLRMGIWPEALYVEIDQGQRIGLHEGYVEVELHSLVTLFFGVPFVFAGLLAWTGEGERVLRRPTLWAALLVGVTLMVLSGRRALFVVLGAAPVFAALLAFWLPPEARRGLVRRGARVVLLAGPALAAVAVALGALYDFRLEAIWDMFVEALHPTRTESMSIRTRQFEALMEDWMAAPLLGTGLGNVAADYVRGAETPWAYELSYVALLQQVGLVGAAVYAGFVAWLVAAGLQVVRAGGLHGRVMYPTLVGLACFLLGNATNPYLQKFDYMWVLFLPLLIVNHWRVTRAAAGAPGGSGLTRARGSP